MRGRNFKLFEISTIITQRETVILIEPPRKDAAPKRAYLKKFQRKKENTFRHQFKNLKIALVLLFYELRETISQLAGRKRGLTFLLQYSVSGKN